MAKKKAPKPAAMATGSPVALAALLRSGGGKHHASGQDRPAQKRAWRADQAA